MLAGTLDLKAEHLTNLARRLRIPPGDLLAASCPRVTLGAAKILLRAAGAALLNRPGDLSGVEVGWDNMRG